MHHNFDDEKNFIDVHEDNYEYPTKMSSPESLIFNQDDSERAESKSNNTQNLVVMNLRFKRILVTSVVVLLILLIALVSYIFYFINNPSANLAGIKNMINSSNTDNGSNSGESAIKIESKPADSNEFSAEAIYAEVSPSVVGVVIYDSHADIISDPISEGSGIIISDKGYVVTNSHVVKNSKQNNVKIVLNTGEEFSGKVIGYDSKTDIAVIKADKIGLKPAKFGNSDEVKVGASALALGNPLGLNFASSLTRGIISAVNRSSNGSAKSLVKYIQTDAAINPGNSGGPLINMYGQVIGINSSKIAITNFEGMGFAIPSNTVKSVVDDIIEKGYVSGRVRLGISGKMVSNYQSQIYNVPIGIIISAMSKDSNLASNGIRTGDIITKINNINITSLDVFYAELYNHKVGESVKLSIYRSSSNRLTSENFDVNIVLLEDKGETQVEASSHELQ